MDNFSTTFIQLPPVYTNRANRIIISHWFYDNGYYVDDPSTDLQNKNVNLTFLGDGFIEIQSINPYIIDYISFIFDGRGNAPYILRSKFPQENVIKIENNNIKQIAYNLKEQLFQTFGEEFRDWHVFYEMSGNYWVTRYISFRTGLHKAQYQLTYG